MSEAVWKMVVDVAQILSALATCAAVIVASRQWSRQFKPNLRVSVAEVAILGEQHRSDCVSVGVVNAGLGKCIIGALQYSPNKWRGERWFQIPDYRNAMSAQLPLSIEPFESKQFFFPTEEWFSTIREVLDEASKKSLLTRFFWKRMFKVELMTTTGERFSARPSKAMIGKIATVR